MPTRPFVIGMIVTVSIAVTLGAQGSTCDSTKVITGAGASRQKSDNSIVLRETNSGEPLKIITGNIGNIGPVLSAAISPDGEVILTGMDSVAKETGGSSPEQVLLWYADTGERLREYFTVCDFWEGIPAFPFSPNGTKVLAGKGGFAAPWDTETAEELRAFASHSSMVTTVGFLQDGQVVVTGSCDGTVKLFPESDEVVDAARVPNLIGKTEEEAVVLINNARLLLGSITRECSFEVATDMVSRQEPHMPGDPVPIGTEINLTISSGICTTDEVRNVLYSNFYAVDIYCDALLSYDEVAAWIPGLPQDIFSTLDSNDDSYISYEETLDPSSVVFQCNAWNLHQDGHISNDLVNGMQNALSGCQGDRAYLRHSELTRVLPDIFLLGLTMGMLILNGRRRL